MDECWTILDTEFFVGVMESSDAYEAFRLGSNLRKEDCDRPHVWSCNAGRSVADCGSRARANSNLDRMMYAANESNLVSSAVSG